MKVSEIQTKFRERPIWEGGEGYIGEDGLYHSYHSQRWPARLAVDLRGLSDAEVERVLDMEIGEAVYAGYIRVEGSCGMWWRLDPSQGPVGPFLPDDVDESGGEAMPQGATVREQDEAE